MNEAITKLIELIRGKLPPEMEATVAAGVNEVGNVDVKVALRVRGRLMHVLSSAPASALNEASGGVEELALVVADSAIWKYRQESR